MTKPGLALLALGVGLVFFALGNSPWAWLNLLLVLVFIVALYIYRLNRYNRRR